MASLVLGQLEILDTDVYKTLLGTDMGSPAPITSSTSSLFLDGAVVSGEASGNREISLTVFIQADTRTEVVAAEEALAVEADRSVNVLTFTPDGGVPVVYEVFRADRHRVDGNIEGRLHRSVTLTIPALPFARSGTRRTPSLSFPPGTGGTVPIIEWGTTTASGVVVDSYSGRSLANETARNFLQGIPVLYAGGLADASLLNNEPGLVLGGMTAVSNSSVTSTSNARNVVATAAGVAVARSTTPLATSAAGVIVGLLFDAANSADIVVQVGVDWFNSAVSLTTPIVTQWGTPVYKGDNRPAWAGSDRPSAATHWGFRVRSTATSGSQSVRVTRVLAEAQTFSSQVISGYMVTSPVEGPTPTPAASWTYLKRSTTVDVSTQTHLQVSLRRTYNVGASSEGTNITFRLHSSGGKWSAWYYRPDAAENTAFPVSGTPQTKFFPLSTPDLVSDAGAAVLSAVEGVSMDIIGLSASSFDYSDTAFQLAGMTAGLGSGVIPPSTRGVVFDVDTILGSARAPAAVHASAGTPMTDVVLQAVDPEDGNPLIQFVSSVATAVAPHGYDGVYSVLGTRISGTSPVAPVVTVTQKQDGVTVASRALDGYVRPGGNYVDFGVIGLPLVKHSEENVTVSLTFAVTPTSASWGEVLVLNTNSPLMMLEEISPAREHVFIDEPAIAVGIGDVLIGDEADRTDAASPLQPPILSLPFTVRAPGVKIFAYSTSDGPSISLKYRPAWLVEPS